MMVVAVENKGRAKGRESHGWMATIDTIGRKNETFG
jgi:hypothetical protein